MKHLARTLVAELLAVLARAVLAKYRPTVVMVTGSVGKTSTKDAVAAALSRKFHLRASEKSYNSEFGVPLTIFGCKNPWDDPSAWARTIGEALALIFLPNHYPRLLVLEVGADRPGDLTKILRIAVPDAVVVTKLPDIPVHVELYPSAEAVREEEFAPAGALPAGAPLIICADDQNAVRLSAVLPVEPRTFGFSKTAHVQIKEVGPYIESRIPCGMRAELMVEGTAHALVVRGALGRSQVFAPAAALALAMSLGVSAEEAMKGLQSYVPPPGRARILKGKKGALVIDDSYNASPAAVEEVVASLPKPPHGGRRIVVLGDMLELGRYSAEQHARIGTLAAAHADVAVSVGGRARPFADAAEKAGIPVMRFETADEAKGPLAEFVHEGDIVLVKGSQSIRTERIVKALLLHSEDERHLVRQETQWLKR
jgi:UDP-N-acetylmuramoyl-tripeptide--D-alanyl-D-alanine ligase